MLGKERGHRLRCEYPVCTFDSMAEPSEAQDGEHVDAVDHVDHDTSAPVAVSAMSNRTLSVVLAVAVLVGLGALAAQCKGVGTSNDVSVDEKVGRMTSALNTATSAKPTTTITPPVTLQPAVVPGTEIVSTTIAPTTAPTPVPAPAVPTAAGPGTTAPPALTVPGPPIAPVRWAVFSGGTVFLRGVVPDDATAANIAGKAAQIVGADHVVDEYTRVAGAPVPKSAPLYVADLVLFGTDNADIYPGFEQLLNLGVGLLTTFPTITVTIRGHTDNLGSATYNAELAQRRVNSVIAYLTHRGVSRDRLIGDAVGAEQPLADNATEHGRQLNRRIEFVVDGLLDA
jgi:outer membrane protein OmpA-like peptidoglycan-associated protein